MCTLPHSLSCPGGIAENESWRACPTNYIVGQVVTGLEYEQQVNSNGVQQTSASDLLRFEKQARGEGAKERHPGMEHIELGNDGVNPHDVLPLAVEEQVRLLRAQNQQAQHLGTAGGDVQLSIADIRKIPGMQDLVGNQMDKFQEIIPALSAAASGSHPPLAKTNLNLGQVTVDPQGLNSGHSDELSKSEAEYSELVAKQKQVEEAIKAQNEILVMQEQQSGTYQFAAHTPQQSNGAQESPAPSMTINKVSAPPPSDLLQRELSLQQREQQRLQEALQIQKQQFDALLLQQQQQAALFAAQKLKFEQEQTAAKIREQKEKNARVAAELRAAEQALANLQIRQSSTKIQSHFQPQHSLPSSNVHVDNSSRASVPVMDGAAVGDVSFTPVYDYFRRPDGSVYKVMKMPSIQQASHGHSLHSGQHHISSPTLHQPGQQPAMRAPSSSFLEWRVNQETGVPYQVLVQPTIHKFQHSSQLGTPYQQQQHAPEIQQLPGQSTPQPQPYRSPQYPQATGQNSGPENTSVAQQLKDRVAGIVSLVESGGETKQLKLLDHVRSCPAKWAKKVTLDNMNLPVYAYGVTSELTSSLSGRSPAMSPEVLLSKLQHLQNTLRVCCLNTTEKEFSNYGWVLARDYSIKVQDRVTQNLTSWENLSSDVQTSDLVASQMEFPRPFEKKVPEKKEEKKQQPLCTTWNTCTTEKKCQYELDHPGRSCLRKHECSHCREAFKQSHRHQLWKCPSK